MGKQRTWAVALICGTAVACGDDNDEAGTGGSGDVDTGLSRTELLSNLTSAQASQACESVVASTEAQFASPSFRASLCESSAAAFTEDPSTCSQVASDCQSQTASAGLHLLALDGADIGCDPSLVMDSLNGCTATVGQLESCFSELIGALVDSLSAFDCSDAGSLSEAQVTAVGDPETPAACQLLEAACPGLEVD